VPASNFALRRIRGFEAGGFDEAFTADWPLAEVELLVRLGKRGLRFRYLPSARAVNALPRGDRARESFEPDRELEISAAELRSLAAVFARYESWAVPIMFTSRMLQAILDVAARRLPPHALGRLAAAVGEGLRSGARPVAGRLAPGRKEPEE